MVDDEPSGPQRDLWALPSEELPPGAAVFLDMARDLQAGLGDPASGWIGTGAPEDQDPEDLVGPDLMAPPSADSADPVPERPNLRLVASPEGSPGQQPEPAASEGAGSGGVIVPGDEAGSRVFLEMVDLVDTVRPITTDDAEDEPAIPDWFWAAGEEGIPASEVLLSTIERAIQHVNQSEDIRSEEVRSRLLDLFTDFAVRRPWRDEERPEAQRIQRLPEQPPEDEPGRAPGQPR